MEREMRKVNQTKEAPSEALEKSKKKNKRETVRYTVNVILILALVLSIVALVIQRQVREESASRNLNILSREMDCGHRWHSRIRLRHIAEQEVRLAEVPITDNGNKWLVLIDILKLRKQGKYQRLLENRQS